MNYFLNLLMSGLVIGSLYGLIAMGFAIVYRATGMAGGRDNQAPQFCDACFTGDYPIALADRDSQSTSGELPLWAARA